MKKNILRIILFLFYPFLLYPQWVSDPSNNLAICTADQTQRETRVCNDVSGNIVILWRDYRNEATIFGGDLYSQKLDVAGTSLWSNNGRSIFSGLGGQFDPKFICDNENGFYLAWRTSPGFFQDYSLSAQRINNDGDNLWGSSGISIHTGSGTTLNPSVIMNEDGDLLITWQLGLIASNTMDVYSQKVDKSGNVKWNSNGLPVCLTTARSILGPKIISDQNGGAYVCWSDNRNGVSNFDIYAQRISSIGAPLWSINGIPICTTTGSQGTKHIFSDNDGGAIFFWEDIQETSYSIYGQRIDSSGNKLWESDGRLLYSTTTPFTQYEFILGRDKEIFFVWSTLEGNIFAQKVDNDGIFVWANPIPICTSQSAMPSLAICKSDISGVIVIWIDNRNGNYDIYAQWINTDGLTRWNNNGTAVCIESHEQSDISIIPDNFGGAVIAWADMRNGNFDIYSQNIDARGILGTNRFQFQRSELSKIISNSNQTPDTLIISLSPKEETGYYSVSVILDSILHPAVNELTIKLTHLTNTDTLVFNLSAGENFINTVLDDFALSAINTSVSPFTGMFKPYNPLDQFIGSDLNGEWILSIEDNNPVNNGVLKSWGLVFNNGEITNIDNNYAFLPTDFILNQNYPNPFNPSTKISWQSPVGSWQTIKLFDVLGNEIATLVNEYKSAGSYVIEFNPTSINKNLASGIYFYQLKIGDLIHTNKMIFIK